MSEAAAFEPPRAFEEFRIVRALGAGAMGEVFLAEDELLGRNVAIKFVRQADRPEIRARFLLEARALARLSHPNVVTVHRVGEVLGRPFLVSEWVKGDSLDKAPRPLPDGTILQIALQLARALAAVHRVGVLHRDVKPANVLLAESGEVKLVDFGVSTELDEALAPPPKAAPLTSLAETQPLPDAPRFAPQPRPALQAGTPLYAAPELLAGAPASRQSDLYAWGAVLYELCSGRPPHPATTLDELKGLAEAGNFEKLTGVPLALAELVHQCLSPRPHDRPARAEALLEALEPFLLAGAGAALPDEPYRGLSVFGPEHAALFFGREREARAVVERLRAASFVLVAGDSGVGKTSLCRAGVLPQLQAGALDRARRFQVIEISLGTRPVEALGAALGPWLGVDERAAAAALRSAPEQVAVRVRAAAPNEGRALFLDGLEELAALAPEDAETVGRFLGALAVRSHGFRLLATARSDFLTRLSALPSLGPEVGSALYLLSPLSDEGLRQAIEGPARAAGFRFAPESLVDELVAAAKASPGALPLVQFALAELWRKRDPARKLIAREALVQMGGVGGALARHADGVVSALPPQQRAVAEQILLRLVTAQGTRGRRSRKDLPEGEGAERALAALTSARLLTSREGEGGKQDTTFELAHEALIQNWDQLRAWIGRDAEKRALAQRVEQAAEEWERLGSGAEGRWSRRQVHRLDRYQGLPLGDREKRFLASSRAAARRARALLILGAALVPCAVALIVLGARHRAQAASREQAALRLGSAQEALASARLLDREEAAARALAFAKFDTGDAPGGELAWTRVRAVRAKLEQALTAARGSVEGALLLAPGDEARAMMVSLLVFRLERERGNPLSRERQTLLGELSALDPKASRGAFEQPARLRLADLPAGARAILRPLSEPGAASIALAGEERTVKPGAYVLEVAPATRLPLLLRYGESAVIKISPAPSVPEDFIHVPAGRFLAGFEGDEDVRLGFFNAPPLHERETQAFLIARHEVTFAEWIAWLRVLPAAERARRLPRAETLRNGLALDQRRDGRFVLSIKPTTTQYQAAEGEPLRYPGRRRNASVDWLRCPVTGISFEDASAYARWLDSSGRVPGARLCAEEEWERAARGADGRSFPGGDSLAGDEANLDETYGREPLAFGPDPVGSHPQSDSPIGAADMAGNAWDMTLSRAGTPVLRGGSWYQGALTARSVNREPYEPTARDLLIGLRLCATPP